MDDFFSSLNNAGGIEFMDKRTKGDAATLIGRTVTILDYGFIKSNDGGDYAVFIVKEDDDNFYFGNSVLTDKLHMVDNAGRKDEIHLHPVTFTTQVSKKGPRKGKTYTMVTFA